MERILILGAGEMQIPIIRKAKQLGVYCIAIDADVHAPGLILADESALISTMDYDQILKFAIEKKITGILTTSDAPVNIVAKVSEALKLTSMSIDVANFCTNKYLQRKLFSQNGIITPNFTLISNKDELASIKGFPVIIKPVDSSGSRGVKKVNDFDELFRQFDTSVKYSKSSQVIVEEYIEGREFSVEAFTQNNITTIISITEKLTRGEKKGFFVEDTHIIPARVTEIEEENIKAEVLKVITRLKINNCPTHSEVKLNNKGVIIIEIACRLGGDYITSDLVPLATGVDMLENLIKLSLGNDIDVKAKFNKVAAIQFLNESNYFNGKKFIDTKSNKIILSEIKNFHNDEITSSFERMGYIILNTGSIEEMNDLINELNEK